MDTYGLVGFPLGHSFSKNYFSRFFEEQHLDACYRNFELPSLELFSSLLDETPTLRGLNVTIPYKQQILPYLNKLDASAQEIGAVNVIQIRRANGQRILRGYNTDFIGFTHSIAPLLLPYHSKALVLGTGGASKAVTYGLRTLGIESCLISRTPGKGQFTYSQLNAAILQEYTVIVNASPVGTFPKVEECPPLPYEGIGPRHLLFDLVYNPEETLFLQKGKAQGAITRNGMEMLIGQAQAAWAIWNQSSER